MIEFAKSIYPIHRSITGKGVLKTLSKVKKKLPNLKISNFSSGSKVFDWQIPPEWNITEGYIAKLNGEKIIDFKKNNLRVVSYSTPINKIISKNQLLKHIHTIPNKKNSIPYVTSYYKKYWGFCLKHNELKLLKDKRYKVVISSKFNSKGKLHYGEYFIKGRTKKELIIHTYICHPQLANNETSGPVVVTYLAKFFYKKYNNLSLRFLFLPETIGAIAYLKHNINKLKENVIGGYVITCVGDEKNYSFLETKDRNSLSNKIAFKTFKQENIKFKNYHFLDRGSDERQYNSPGIDLPIASIMRSKYGKYSEYHTSDDDFKLVTNKGLKDSYKIIKKIIQNFDEQIIPISTYKCEPFLSKRKLYPTLSTGYLGKFYKNITDLIAYSDGKRTLNDISKILKIRIKDLMKIYILLKKNKLLY